jgi:hypothetical protein
MGAQPGQHGTARGPGGMTTPDRHVNSAEAARPPTLPATRIRLDREPPMGTRPDEQPSASAYPGRDRSQSVVAFLARVLHR